MIADEMIHGCLPRTSQLRRHRPLPFNGSPNQLQEGARPLSPPERLSGTKALDFGEKANWTAMKPPDRTARLRADARESRTTHRSFRAPSRSTCARALRNGWVRRCSTSGRLSSPNGPTSFTRTMPGSASSCESAETPAGTGSRLLCVTGCIVCWPAVGRTSASGCPALTPPAGICRRQIDRPVCKLCGLSTEDRCKPKRSWTPKRRKRSRRNRRERLRLTLCTKVHNIQAA